jgi:hypothetical protein
VGTRYIKEERKARSSDGQVVFYKGIQNHDKLGTLGRKGGKKLGRKWGFTKKLQTCGKR